MRIKPVYLVFIVGGYLFFGTDCSEAQNKNKRQANDTIEYFMDIAYGNEFGNRYTNLRKWNSDVRIYVHNQSYSHLNEELEKIVQELNEMIDAFEIQIVPTKREANYYIFYGAGQEYVRLYEPNAESSIHNNWGLFWIYWDGDCKIYKGSMFVDIFKANKEEQKHLLREELTQSLGLMNDNDQYPESIFYVHWTSPTAYAEIDKKLIKYLYSSKLQPGMKSSNVREILYNTIVE